MFQVDNTLSGQYSAVMERKLSAILLALLIFFSLLIVDDFCFYAMQAKKVDRECKLKVAVYAVNVMFDIIVEMKYVLRG